MLDQLGIILKKSYSRRDFLAKAPQALRFFLASQMLGYELKKMDYPKVSRRERLMEKRLYSRIAIENRKLGSPYWRLTRMFTPNLLNDMSYIQGYASHVSVHVNEEITFYVHSEKSYRLDIFRMGYYQGIGACTVHSSPTLPLQRQNLQPYPADMGCSWIPSYSFLIPSDWLTGFYLVKCIDIEGRESYISFILSEHRPKADFAVLLATNTYQAYNGWGGRSLYSYNSLDNQQSTRVSFNRPYSDFFGSGLFFQYEYGLVRWLEKEGYSVTYVSDTDLHNGLLDQADIKALLVAGHDEYWSYEMRNSVEKKMASHQMNLANFSANVCYWQVRMESDQGNRANRVMVCYKQFVKQDPILNPTRKTTRWRDAPVANPEDRLLGMMYSGIPKQKAPLIVTDANHWLFTGTGLRNGDRIEGMIGGEVDSYSGLPGVEVIARSPVMTKDGLREVHLTWYNRPAGGKVFSVGTFYWNWFLDPYHYRHRVRENPQVQRITKNALSALRRKP